jgi:hypothetical protein
LLSALDLGVAVKGVMGSTFILSELLSGEWRSVSWIRRIDVPRLEFERALKLELFSSEIREISRRILAVAGAGLADVVPICHLTLKDGSEQDLYAYFVQRDGIVLFLEISHSYVDQHFLQFQLWGSDRDRLRGYPVDELFHAEAIDERTPEGAKVDELFVAPVQLTIHTVNFDPLPYLPAQHELARLKEELGNYPYFAAWKHWQQGRYSLAADTLKNALGTTDSQDTSAASAGLLTRVLYAAFRYWADDYGEAARWFLSAARGYVRGGFARTADTCIFLAIEAGKRMVDKNAAADIAGDIVACLSFLNAVDKSELASILSCYYSDVYIAAVVLCRRLVELRLSDLLVSKHGGTESIKQLVKKGKAAGKTPKDAGPGLFSVLALALADAALTESEHKIATHIKDFGNRIHDRGGVQNELDAKYAIQSCIHLLHRI